LKLIHGITNDFSFNIYPAVFVIRNGENIVFCGEIANVEEVITEIKNNP